MHSTNALVFNLRKQYHLAKSKIKEMSLLSMDDAILLIKYVKKFETGKYVRKQTIHKIVRGYVQIIKHEIQIKVIHHVGMFVRNVVKLRKIVFQISIRQVTCHTHHNAFLMGFANFNKKKFHWCQDLQISIRTEMICKIIM